MTEEEAAKRLKELLSDKLWRLNNLYTITDKDGNRVKFKLNSVQQELFEAKHPFLVVLKSRQHGVSTYAAIDALDTAFFCSNTNAAIIAQTQAVAKGIYDKIRLAYESMPSSLRKIRSTLYESTTEIKFNNGSSIRAGTSIRGGSYQWLHISEYGYISAHFPDKAQEIRTGALNTVHVGQRIIVESTAEGTSGAFYELCKHAMRLDERTLALTAMDPKFFFFPWYKDPKNTLDAEMELDQELSTYLDTINKPTGLTTGQRSWYAKKKALQGDMIFREYPSTPTEAFEGSATGSYYKNQFKYLRANNRLAPRPWNPNYPVYTAWDLGGADYTSVWYFQDLPEGLTFIRYYENFGVGWDTYVKEIKSHPYTYAKHLFPHDGDQNRVVEQGLATAQEMASKLGLKDIHIVNRAKSVSWEIMNKCQPALMTCYFNVPDVQLGVERLENYRRRWNTTLANWSDEPVHDECSHAADAFRTAVMGMESGGLKAQKPFHAEMFNAYDNRF